MIKLNEMITPLFTELCDDDEVDEDDYDDETRLESNKNKYRNLCAGLAQRGQKVTHCWKLGLLTVQCSSASHTPSVHPPALP